MSGRIPPGGSQNPYQYYTQNNTSSQGTAQDSSRQQSGSSRSGTFSTHSMYNALPGIQTTNLRNGTQATTHSPRRPGSSSGNGMLLSPAHRLSHGGGFQPFPSPSPVSDDSFSSSAWNRALAQARDTRSPASSGSTSRSGSLFNSPLRSPYSPHFSPLSAENSANAHGSPGHELTDVRQLPPHEQRHFLNKHDPYRALNLNEHTHLYRATERRFIQNGHIGGNPNSMARIARHDKLVPNAIGRNVFHAAPGTAEAYKPASGYASELGPSLNVMTGSGARGVAERYGNTNPDNIVVRMKLGDFLQRGGRVYADSGAAAGNGNTNPLVVTLPHPQTVPVEIVGRRS